MQGGQARCRVQGRRHGARTSAGPAPPPREVTPSRDEIGPAASSPRCRTSARWHRRHGGRVSARSRIGPAGQIDHRALRKVAERASARRRDGGRCAAALAISSPIAAPCHGLPRHERMASTGHRLSIPPETMPTTATKASATPPMRGRYRPDVLRGDHREDHDQRYGWGDEPERNEEVTANGSRVDARRGTHAGDGTVRQSRGRAHPATAQATSNRCSRPKRFTYRRPSSQRSGTAVMRSSNVFGSHWP